MTLFLIGLSLILLGKMIEHHTPWFSNLQFAGKVAVVVGVLYCGLALGLAALSFF